MHTLSLELGVFDGLIIPVLSYMLTVPQHSALRFTFVLLLCGVEDLNPYLLSFPGI